MAAPAPDRAVWQKGDADSAIVFREIEKSSVYVGMPDGTRLAVDVILPKALAAGQRLPVILWQTRYWRAASMQSDPSGSCAAVPPYIRYFVERGFAAVDVDVRGTGASFGRHLAELGRQEIQDDSAIIEWIIRQPWSDGRVGATGFSYSGSAAELLLATHHPAIKAIAPVSAVFDAYADLFFPGGIPNRFFRESWGGLTESLDNGLPPDIPMAKGVIGPCPVDSDPDRTMLSAAIADHAENFKVAAALASPRSGETDDAISGKLGDSVSYREELEHVAVPALFIAGWQDSGYARSAINRWLNSSNSFQRLIVAPGNHHLTYFYGPGVTAPTPSLFDLNAELLAFFKHFLAGEANGYEENPRVRWFVTGKNVWQSADDWPLPRRYQAFCLAVRGRLTDRCGPREKLTVSPKDAGTGSFSRWETTASGSPVFYSDRRDQDKKLVVFDSAPLNNPLTVIGSPEMDLVVSSARKDSNYFVYLEEVDPTGHAYLVGEGEMSGSPGIVKGPSYRNISTISSDLGQDKPSSPVDRQLKLRIGFLPLAHEFSRGNRIRLTLAGSDRAHFEDLAGESKVWTIALGKGGSILRLPIIK